MLYQVVVAVLLAVAYAQVPPPCNAPGLFSANLMAVSQSLQHSLHHEARRSPVHAQLDTERGYQVQARYYYDYLLQRKARFEVVDANRCAPCPS